MITALDFSCKYLVVLLCDDICCLMPGKFTFVWYRMLSYLNTTCLYIRSISTKMIHIIISFERLDTSNVFVLPFTGYPAEWEVYFPVSRRWKILQLAFYTNTLKSKQFTLLNFGAMYRLQLLSSIKQRLNQRHDQSDLWNCVFTNQHFIVSLPYIYFWKCFCNSACISTFTLYCKITISFFLDCCKQILAYLICQKCFNVLYFRTRKLCMYHCNDFYEKYE